MKKLFLTSSFADVAKFLPGFTNEECSSKTVTFIPTASTVEKVNFFVGSARKAFKKLGLTIDELDIANASKEEIVTKLSNNDYIYISGGNTFYLLQELKRTGADRVITDQINSGKIYIGESAGSMVLSPNIEYVKQMDDCTKAPELKSNDALAIVEFYPLPHHTNFPFKKIVEKILKEYETKLDLRPMNNKQALAVCGDQIELIE